MSRGVKDAKQARISAKIGKLVREGTPDGHGQAGAIAHSMERAGRLRSGGVYVRKGKK